MMMMGLKTFPVSVVRISMGMAPIVGVLLAWLYLNEETQCFDIFSIFVGISASLLIILGQAQADISTDPQITISYKIALVGLFLLPILQASGSVAVRGMKKISPLTITFYLSSA